MERIEDAADNGLSGLNSEMFHDIPSLHDFALLLKVMTWMGEPIPPQVFKEECM